MVYLQVYACVCNFLFSFVAVYDEDFEAADDFEIVFESSLSGSVATRCAEIDFISDELVEGLESFVVSVSSVTPSIVSGDDSQMVTVEILDNSGKMHYLYNILYITPLNVNFYILCKSNSAEACEVRFVSESYTVSEDGGSLSVCVELTDLPSGGLGTDLTVNIVSTDGPLTSMLKNY